MPIAAICSASRGRWGACRERCVRSAPDAAAVPVLRSPGHRRRRGGPLHRVPEQDIGRCEGDAVSTVEVKVPDIGDSKDVAVVEVLVAPGADIRVDDPLITLESEKAS